MSGERKIQAHMCHGTLLRGTYMCQVGQLIDQGVYFLYGLASADHSVELIALFHVGLKGNDTRLVFQRHDSPGKLIGFID